MIFQYVITLRPKCNHSSGLYCKHLTIVNDNSSVISKWSFKLIDDPRVFIYDRHRFIIQATACVKTKQTLNFKSGSFFFDFTVGVTVIDGFPAKAALAANAVLAAAADLEANAALKAAAVLAAAAALAAAAFAAAAFAAGDLIAAAETLSLKGARDVASRGELLTRDAFEVFEMA